MDNIARPDADGDGLPDHDTRRNTYDGWNFAGTPAYIASLWLAALGAAVRLAEALGHGERAEAWRAMLERGAASFEAKLWNGEYYSLWVDGPARDECCMSDQVSGEWFAHLVGIGSALPLERVRAALRAIFRYNYTEENGLANASYPPDRARRLATYGNCQQIAPWTGVEYAVASMLLDYGLVAEGERVVRNIHARYLGAGRFWNHVECGDHYYRAMSSWAVLLGATGFRLDAPRGRVRFAPVYRAPRFRGPWVAPTGWGTFEREASRYTLRCEAGALAFRELSLNLESDCACAELNGKAIEALSANSEGEALVLRFADTVSVREGDLFVVSRA